MKIPLFDARREYEAHADAYREAAERVLASGRYILGPEVEAFEREVAEYVGTEHAVSCASGTDALWLALKAAGVGPGDAVIAPAFTFFATASAVLSIGSTPVLSDIDPATFNIDAGAMGAILEGTSDVHNRLSVDPARIKAIVPVHLYGQTADMDRVLEVARTAELRVVEDAAQAFGAEHGGRKAGAMGDAGCFSFFPTKNVGGFGDGGLVTTDDDELACELRMLRNHGGESKYSNVRAGTNSRLDEVQAALLRIRLRDIDEALDGRRRVADLYDELLSGADVVLPFRSERGRHSFNGYIVRVRDRDRVREELAAAGIGTAVHYPTPVHLQPAIGVAYKEGDFSESERACAEVLTLPMSPHLTGDEIRYVAETLSSIVGSRAPR